MINNIVLVGHQLFFYSVRRADIMYLVSLAQKLGEKRHVRRNVSGAAAAREYDSFVHCSCLS